MSNAASYQQAKNQLEIALTGKMVNMIIDSGKDEPPPGQLTALMELLKELKRP